MNYLKKLFAGALLALAFNAPAHAVDYYIVDCQPGADAACVPGDDARTATQAQNPATPWRTWAGVPMVNKVGNTRFLFGRGGYLTDVSIGLSWWTNNGTGNASETTEDAPMTFDAYTPSWCVGACATTKPVLEQTTIGKDLFASDTNGTHLNDGGYIMRNLKLQGGGTPIPPKVVKAERAFFFYDMNRGVTIENMEITGFQSAVAPANGNNMLTYNLIVRNSYIHHNGSSVFGGATGLLVENNLFEYNGDPLITPDSHDMYLSYVTNGVIRNNIFRNTTYNADGKCAKTILVVHGRINGLLIEGNRFEQPGGLGTCYGIEADNGYDMTHPETMSNVTIRDNLLYNVGGAGIVVGICNNCVIESNRIVWTSVTNNCSIGISTFGGNAPKSIDTPNQHIAIRNNSIYMDCTGSGGIRAIDTKNVGTEHSLTNNLMVFGPNTADRTSRTCFNRDTTNSPSNFLATGNNICYSAGGALTWSNLHSTLSAAQAAGWDAGSMVADPLFVATPSAANDYSLAVQSGSPAVNAGNQTHKSRLSAGRKFPIGARDIGAFDYGATVVAPVPPILFR